MKRTANCGELRKPASGSEITLNGWVHRKRDHGGIFFINLRDRYGITQVVIDADAPEELSGIAASLKNEYCIAVSGKVRMRPENMINAEMPTGEIELAAEKIAVLGKAEILPFQIDDEANAKEELRLKYRYLDLRRPSMQKKIALRSEVSFAAREYLTGKGFYEIETPTFIRSTPEGARDFLVPSRLYRGKFYALPQSPQLYKQILMVSGFDKYFQIARCYRDEDARGDRQPEFTQIDIEMSFAGRDDVISMTEELMSFIFKKTINTVLPLKFKRFTYEEAMELYGSDKPDLRFEMQLKDFSQRALNSDFANFKEAVQKGEEEKAGAAAKGISAEGGAVKAIVVPGKADFSRKQIEELEAHAKIFKANGMAWMKVKTEDSFEGGVSKFFVNDAVGIIKELGAQPGDLILMIASSKRKIANTALGAVRSKLGNDLGLCDPCVFEFAWIVDFPLFEWNENEEHWEAAHHLFSFPQEKYHLTMEQDPGSVKGDLYDLVLNGFELASGSIRIHDPQLQKRIFAIAGIDPKEAESKFGFLTESFKYGAPPHGGIAPGLDRLVMIMAGETSIKEVIAFPKNTFAMSLLDGSPAEVSPAQLEELALSVKEDLKEEKTEK